LVHQDKLKNNVLQSIYKNMSNITQSQHLTQML